MASGKPRLIAFGISHYCEKARWALDRHGIPFDEVGWPPGLHLVLARRLGAPATSLPILVHGDAVIQGSDEIIDWTERHAGGGTATSMPAAQAEITRRANDVIGVHVRRLLYAETLTDHSHLVKPALFLNTSPWHRLAGNMMWPKTRKMMILGMDAGPEAAAESRARLEAELEWLDATLEDGRRYLVGERFSRVDLTVASLLAPFARPKEAGVHSAMTLPRTLADDVARWRERRSMQWVTRMYRDHRRQH